MKKKTVLIIILAAALLAAAVFGIYRLATYESANHADRLSDSALDNYNRTVSAKAMIAGHMRTREVVLLESITKTQGQDAVAVFRIYQLPAGANSVDYMHLRAGQVEGLEEVGVLTCRIVGNDPSTAYDIKASYTR